MEDEEEDEVEDTHVRPATSKVRKAALAALAAVIMFMVSVFGFLLWLMKLGRAA